MPYAELAYDKPTVDLAGDALIGDSSAYLELAASRVDHIQVLNNWRRAHDYPLNTFQMTLRHRAKRVDPSAIVAQRIKRRSSIEDKLRRLNWLKLSDMQDIAGCRVIVSSVDHVYELVEEYSRKYSGHTIDSRDDYINRPKSDGYRSYHMIYRYSNEKFSGYDDLKVEMQFRSQLQHCWATAVETTDIFYREGLKSHRGSPEWRRFFTLMGAAIAIHEGRHRVPGTPRGWNELIDELRDLAEKLEVQPRLAAFGTTLNVIGESDTQRVGVKYIVLALNPELGAESLTLYGFKASDMDQAAAQMESEESLTSEGEDVVLVSVADAASLRRAYPNYFFDTTLFLDTLEMFIS